MTEGIAASNRRVSSPVTSKIDFPTQALRAFGLEIDQISPERVTGRLQITPKCCQPFGVLHGGVSAMIAEELGSFGAYIASGRRGAAGIQLSINHLKSAQVGDLVFAEATPVNSGKTIQVWEVKLFKIDPNNCESSSLIASSRVTLLCKVPEKGKHEEDNLISRAKL